MSTDTSNTSHGHASTTPRKASNVEAHPRSLDWLAIQIRSLQHGQDTLYAKLYEPAAVAQQLHTEHYGFVEQQRLWVEQIKQRLRENKRDAYKLAAVLAGWNVVLTVGLLASWLVG
jgi:hypothetical protein